MSKSRAANIYEEERERIKRAEDGRRLMLDSFEWDVIQSASPAGSLARVVIH